MLRKERDSECEGERERKKETLQEEARAGAGRLSAIPRVELVVKAPRADDADEVSNEHRRKNV